MELLTAKWFCQQLCVVVSRFSFDLKLVEFGNELICRNTRPVTVYVLILSEIRRCTHASPCYVK